MNTSQAEAQANLELILSQVKGLCKGVRFSRRKSRQGRPSKYPHWYILQLVVIQYLLGFNSERAYLRFLQKLKLSAFRELPDQSLYNRRAKSLRPLIQRLNQKLLAELKVKKSKIRILDATPVPVVKYSRAKRRKVFLDKQRIGIGYCASQKTYFCGLKLNLLTNQDGIPCQYEFIPGNQHDLKGLRKFTERRELRDLVIIADKGYLVKSEERLEFKKKHLIRLITPFRKNQKKINTKKEKRLLKKRKIIELSLINSKIR